MSSFKMRIQQEITGLFLSSLIELEPDRLIGPMSTSSYVVKSASGALLEVHEAEDHNEQFYP